MGRDRDQDRDRDRDRVRDQKSKKKSESRSRSRDRRRGKRSKRKRKSRSGSQSSSRSRSSSCSRSARRPPRRGRGGGGFASLPEKGDGIVKTIEIRGTWAKCLTQDSRTVYKEVTTGQLVCEPPPGFEEMERQGGYWDASKQPVSLTLANHTPSTKFDVEAMFFEAGTVLNVSMLDEKGIAFIEMENYEAAANAMRMFHGSPGPSGRPLKVELSKHDSRGNLQKDAIARALGMNATTEAASAATGGFQQL